MNEQIKQRISQLNNGEVPSGYEKTEFGIFPCDWVKDKTFGDLFDFYGGLGKSRDELGDEGHAYLHYGDLHRGAFNIVSHEQYEQLPKYDVALKGTETYLMEDGDVAFLDASEDLEGTSRAVLIDNPDNEPFIAGLHIIYGKSKEESLEKWYKQYITTSESVRKQFQRLAAGFKVYGVNRDTLPRIQVAYPKSIEEQSKIAEILMKWDEAIQLNEQLVEQLINRKNAVTRQLLTGEFRLPGFSDEWKEREISNYLEVRDTQQVPTEEAPLMAFVAGVGIVDKGERYDRSFLVKDDAKKYKRTEMDDFIYSSNNLDVGSIGLNKHGTAVISVVYEIFKVKSNAVPLVISEIIQLPYNLNKVLSFRQGALYGQYKIHAQDFLSVKIKVPSYEEQEKIAEFICMLNEELTTKQEYLEAIKKQRQALQRYLLNGIVRV